ncbi:hypothetical protein Sjap_015407 [Stephania japonica]|uniref:Uncharacterized protein n=1 Tax=Stephania japonica TaxID=461633 RepID=A0AAP0IJU4_9MAGN
MRQRCHQDHSDWGLSETSPHSCWCLTAPKWSIPGEFQVVVRGSVGSSELRSLSLFLSSTDSSFISHSSPSSLGEQSTESVQWWPEVTVLARGCHDQGVGRKQSLTVPQSPIQKPPRLALLLADHHIRRLSETSPYLFGVSQCSSRFRPVVTVVVCCVLSTCSTKDVLARNYLWDSAAIKTTVTGDCRRPFRIHADVSQPRSGPYQSVRVSPASPCRGYSLRTSDIISNVTMTVLG